MTRIRAVCFDFQGTLARFRTGDAFDLYVEAASEHGITLSREQIMMPTEEAWAEFATPEGPDHRAHSWSEAAFVAIRAGVHARRLRAAGVEREAAEVMGRRIDELESQPERYVLYDDVLPALDGLSRAGILFVIVSNHVWRLSDIVQALLGGRFEGVVNSARVGVRKPHPLIFRRALTMASIEPHAAHEALMVGDSLDADVRGAEAVGMRALLLDRDASAGQIEGVRVIRSLREIPTRWEWRE